MAGVDDLLVSILDGEQVRGQTYAALHGVFRKCGYMLVGHEGPWRTWKHPYYPGLITVRDEGSRAMYPSYWDAAGDHIRTINERGGFL